MTTLDTTYPRFVLDGPLGRALSLPMPAGGEAGPGPAPWIEAVAWEGDGHPAGSALRLSRRFNAIVGSAGVGKTTILLSIARALGADVSRHGDRLQGPGDFSTHVLLRTARGELLVVERPPQRAAVIRNGNGDILDRAVEEVIQVTLLDHELLVALGDQPRIIPAAGTENRRTRQLAAAIDRNAAVYLQARTRLDDSRRHAEVIAGTFVELEKRLAVLQPLRSELDRLRVAEEQQRRLLDRLQGCLADVIEARTSIEGLPGSPSQRRAQAATLVQIAAELSGEIQQAEQALRGVRDESDRLLENLGERQSDVALLDETSRALESVRAAGEMAQREVEMLRREGEQLRSERANLLTEYRHQLEHGARSIETRSHGFLTARIEEDADGGPRLVWSVNVGTRAAPQWSALERASGGQVHLAALLAEMAAGSTPLLLDSIDGMLDASSFKEVLSPVIRERKQERQLIAVTQQPMLPILADAEHIIAVTWRAGEDGGRPFIDIANCGSVTSPGVRAFLERTFFGAREAYAERERAAQENP